MAYTAWSVVFGEQPSAAKWNILGTNDASFNDGTGIAAGAITPEKLLTGTGTSWPWQTWTPSWTGITVGNGTVAATYRQIGKTVNYKVALTFGSTTAFTGTGRVSIPVTAVAHTTYAVVGYGSANNSDSAVYPLVHALISTTAGDIFTMDVNAIYTTTTNAVPFSWGTGDVLYLNGTYEAA